MATERAPVELLGGVVDTSDRCTYEVPFGGPRCDRSAYRHHNGQARCIFHYPGDEKASEFDDLFKAALLQGRTDLRGTWFPAVLNMSKLEILSPVDLSFSVFNDRVDFWGARFRREVSFSYADFRAEAVFSYARFGGDARFDDARFTDRAYFYEAVFERATIFTAAKFGNRVVFGLTTFGSKVKFAHATFDDDVEFAGLDDKPPFRPDALVDFQFARFRKPQGVRFQTLALSPHWFVNVDPRDFQFVDIGWSLNVSLKSQIDELKARGVLAGDRLLRRSLRQLAINAEQNQHYYEASAFRYLAFDIQRRTTARGWAIWRLLWWYWMLSGYGERSSRAFGVLLVVWLTCAALYTKVEFAPVGTPVSVAAMAAPLSADRALTYSAAVALCRSQSRVRPARSLNMSSLQRHCWDLCRSAY